MVGINTKLLHSYPVNDCYTGSASIPKYQTSTFDQNDKYMDSCHFSYSRFGNPTIIALEEAVKCYGGASHGFVFSSGMAAISAVLMSLEVGEHVILPKEVYGGTFQLASQILPRFGIEVSFADFNNLEEVESHIKEQTKMLYIETPSNPLLKVSDIKGSVRLAKKYQLLTAIDNTFMTSLYQKPLDMGCDIVIESLTKFVNGHSDVIGGMIITNDEEIAQLLALYQKNFGAILGVEEAWLVLRGIKTMGLRMEKSVENAEALATFLVNHPKVTDVYYPGLDSHDNSVVHLEQAKNGGCVLSFKIDPSICSQEIIERLSIPIYAVSLGGVESILSHPATMSHACMSKEERSEQGVTDNLFRLSCGIENTEDLLVDFERALS